MKNLTILNSSIAFLSIFLMTSCSVVGGIFKTGMGFGIFITVVVVVGIIALIMRMGRNK